jgi:hypothetical protein
MINNERFSKAAFNKFRAFVTFCKNQRQDQLSPISRIKSGFMEVIIYLLNRSM